MGTSHVTPDCTRGFLTFSFCLEGTGDLKAVQEYLDANPHQLDNRTLFQSNLLHIAARNGQTAIAEELLKRGSDLDALDYVRSRA